MVLGVGKGVLFREVSSEVIIERFHYTNLDYTVPYSCSS